MGNPGFEHSLYPKEKHSFSPFTIGGSFPALSRASAEVRRLWSWVIAFRRYPRSLRKIP